MNYIELINQFWSCHRENCFSPSEIALYFHLLDTANSLAWKNPFREGNQVACASLGISEPTLQRSRDRLVKAGLIDYQSGKVKRELTEYRILEVGINNLYQNDTQSSTQSDTQTEPQSNTQSSENAFDFNKHKLNKRVDDKSSLSANADLHAEKIDYDKLVEFFNSETKGVFGRVMMPLSDKRRKLIAARIKERGKESFAEALKKAAASNFLRGDNQRGFTATFDWIIKPTNFEKILSGNYDNRTQKDRGSHQVSDDEFMQALKEGAARGLYERERSKL
ncbi:MAG: hypothetical protein H6Q17_540 [Bacteroidetes bacterium]|nr:hypothetical protein [Bacteroidota bacterium]